MFLKNKKPVTHKFKMFNKDYEIDFEKMTQFNYVTKKSRNVSRVFI
jgi:hypothetical protein